MQRSGWWLVQESASDNSSAEIWSKEFSLTPAYHLFIGTFIHSYTAKCTNKSAWDTRSVTITASLIKTHHNTYSRTNAHTARAVSYTHLRAHETA